MGWAAARARPLSQSLRLIPRAKAGLAAQRGPGGKEACRRGKGAENRSPCHIGERYRGRPAAQCRLIGQIIGGIGNRAQQRAARQGKAPRRRSLRDHQRGQHDQYDQTGRVKQVKGDYRHRLERWQQHGAQMSAIEWFGGGRQPDGIQTHHGGKCRKIAEPESLH